MRIAIVTFGSQGDVYPYLALGKGLQAAGHDVLLVTHALFETLIRSRGLDFAAVELNPRDVLDSEAGQNWLDTGNNSLRFFWQLARIAGPILQQTMLDCWKACQGVEAMLFAPLAIYTAQAVAEKLGVPFAVVSYQPLTPTRAFASPFFPPAPIWLPFAGGAYNRLTHVLSLQAFWHLLRPLVNKARQKTLNLPPLPPHWLQSLIQQQDRPILYGYSPTVVPTAPDWGHWNQVTGYWFLDRPDDWQPPANLLDFLATGPPPVYIGFGSMNNRDPQEVTEVVLKALARSKRRGILLTGWGGISRADLPDEVFVIDKIPLDWLFPHTAAVVHHGGAGTTLTGLRAGVPSVIIPFFGDQPFWGQRVFELGVGPRMIPRKRLSAERLAAAIEVATSDEGMRTRAKAVGERIRGEDGVRKAVAVFERYIGGEGIWGSR